MPVTEPFKVLDGYLATAYKGGVSFKYDDDRDNRFHVVPKRDGKDNLTGIAYRLTYQSSLIGVLESLDRAQSAGNTSLSFVSYYDDVDEKEFAQRLRKAYDFAKQNKKMLPEVWEIVKLCKDDLEQLEKKWPRSK